MIVVYLTPWIPDQKYCVTERAAIDHALEHSIRAVIEISSLGGQGSQAFDCTKHGYATVVKPLGFEFCIGYIRGTASIAHHIGLRKRCKLEVRDFCAAAVRHWLASSGLFGHNLEVVYRPEVCQAQSPYTNPSWIFLHLLYPSPIVFSAGKERRIFYMQAASRALLANFTIAAL